MQFLSGLGDSRLVLIGAVLAAGLLAFYRQNRALQRFAFGFGCCVAAIFVAKLAGLSLAGLGITNGIGSPSGHVALSVVFVGSLTLLAMARQNPFGRALMVVGAAALVLAVGYARIANNAHTAVEVIEGQMIGGACLLPLARSRLDDATRQVPAWPFFLILAAVPAYRAIFPAADLDTESVIAKLTQHVIAMFGH